MPNINKTRELLAYVILNFPEEHILEYDVVLKVMFLSDWKQAIEHKKLITNINWYNGFEVFDYNQDIVKILSKSRLFEYNKNQKEYLQHHVFSIKNKNYKPNLDEDEIISIDHVLRVLKSMSYKNFNVLIQSVYPIYKNISGFLDLNTLAREYEPFRDGKIPITNINVELQKDKIELENKISKLENKLKEKTNDVNSIPSIPETILYMLLICILATGLFVFASIMTIGFLEMIRNLNFFTGLILFNFVVCCVWLLHNYLKYMTKEKSIE